MPLIQACPYTISCKNEFNRFETGNERALDLNSIIPRQARVQLERYLLSIGFNTMKNLEKWTPKGASVGS